MIPRERLQPGVDRHKELESLMSTQTDLVPEDLVRFSKEYSDLTPVVDAVAELRRLEREIDDLAEMIADPDADEEMNRLAEEEAAALQEKRPILESQVQLLLLPKDDADDRSAILEIRAGTGGDEAALFAGDLLRMYQRYAEAHD